MLFTKKSICFVKFTFKAPIKYLGLSQYYIQNLNQNLKSVYMKINNFISLFLFSILAAWHGGILVPRPGMNLLSLQWSNYGIPREVPSKQVF